LPRGDSRGDGFDVDLYLEASLDFDVRETAADAALRYL
jgi:hypothetical protein